MFGAQMLSTPYPNKKKFLRDGNIRNTLERPPLLLSADFKKGGPTPLTASVKPPHYPASKGKFEPSRDAFGLL